MAEPLTPSLIGIDGGATHCRFALLHKGQRYDRHLRGANASSDFQGALEVLREGLLELAQSAEISAQEIRQTAAFIGLAGVVDDAIANAIAQALPLDRVMVEDDRRTALVGALGGAEGCVLGLGTGSFIGRRAEERDQLVGGWGLVLGDEASGAYLGRHLLRLVLETHDGLRAETPLTRAVLASHGPPPAIVVFAATATPRDFAALAPRIVAAARDGDAIALTLMQDGAAYVARALAALGWRAGEQICPLGGLAPHYAPFLSPEIAADLYAPKGTALDGALHLAAEIS